MDCQCKTVFRQVTIRELGVTSCDFNFWAKVQCDKCKNFLYLYDNYLMVIHKWNVGDTKTVQTPYEYCGGAANFIIEK